MTSEHEVAAVLAERYAAAVDRAAKGEDDRALLAAGEKLLDLMQRLPIRQPVAPAGGGDSGGGDGGRVLELYGGGPEMGNAADS